MKAKPVKLIDTQWVQVPIEEATHVELWFPLDIVVIEFVNLNQM